MAVGERSGKKYQGDWMKRESLVMEHKKIWILLIILSLLAVAAGIIFLCFYQNTSAKRPERGKSSESFTSSVDFDGDGTDDQTEILEGALAYVATRPKYKSKYYAGGYPDDSYGVCTDVVARGCLMAGYDLMKLVEEDIAENPKDYDVENPDSNIDFRRVKNLQVYFSHRAIPLTTDISKTKEWQGGDIVVFKNHIGVVSDIRNERGIPYVIHHAGPYQRYYEEDILESFGEIVGHFRISN